MLPSGGENYVIKLIILISLLAPSYGSIFSSSFLNYWNSHRYGEAKQAAAWRFPSRIQERIKTQILDLPLESFEGQQLVTQHVALENSWRATNTKTPWKFYLSILAAQANTLKMICSI